MNHQDLRRRINYLEKAALLIATRNPRLLRVASKLLNGARRRG